MNQNAPYRKAKCVSRFFRRSSSPGCLSGVAADSATSSASSSSSSMGTEVAFSFAFPFPLALDFVLEEDEF